MRCGDSECNFETRHATNKRQTSALPATVNSLFSCKCYIICPKFMQHNYCPVLQPTLDLSFKILLYLRKVLCGIVKAVSAKIRTPAGEHWAANHFSPQRRFIMFDTSGVFAAWSSRSINFPTIGYVSAFWKHAAKPSWMVLSEIQCECSGGRIYEFSQLSG